MVTHVGQGKPREGRPDFSIPILFSRCILSGKEVEFLPQHVDRSRDLFLATRVGLEFGGNFIIHLC